MKLYLLPCVLLGLAAPSASRAQTTSNIQQSTSINSDGAAPAASAMLDVQATDKGVLIPRLTASQRIAIASPATGLLVFDTGVGSFWFYDGTAWNDLSAPSVLADADKDTKIQVEESPDEDVIRMDLQGVQKIVIRKNNTTGNNAVLEIMDPLGNTFIGQSAGSSNTLGIANTAFGRFALNANTTGNSNTAIGRSALIDNTEGDGNTATGASALTTNTTGGNNTATGASALTANTTGSFNTAIGSAALSANTTGANNTATGMGALSFNTTGTNNTANGKGALSANTTGASNTATGFEALTANTTGSKNAAIGSGALTANTTGSFNTATGFEALNSNTTGFANTATGNNALNSNTTGTENTALGFQSLFLNTTGNENTATGHKALDSNTDGGENVAVGNAALDFNTTGSSNTAIGYQALRYNLSGSFNTALGNTAHFPATSLFNTTCIGYFSGNFTSASNRIEIGNASVSFIGGAVNWSTFSDARIKTQVKENVPGLDFIKRLRPVTYHLDIHKQSELCRRGREEEEPDWPSKYDIEKKQMTGFIAQEVEQAALEAGYDFSGVEKGADEVGMYSVRYAEFVVPLVKAMQEQQAMIQQLMKQQAALQSKYEALLSRLDNTETAKGN